MDAKLKVEFDAILKMEEKRDKSKNTVKEINDSIKEFRTAIAKERHIQEKSVKRAYDDWRFAEENPEIHEEANGVIAEITDLETLAKNKMLDMDVKLADNMLKFTGKDIGESYRTFHQESNVEMVAKGNLIELGDFESSTGYIPKKEYTLKEMDYGDEEGSSELRGSGVHLVVNDELPREGGNTEIGMGSLYDDTIGN